MMAEVKWYQCRGRRKHGSWLVGLGLFLLVGLISHQAWAEMPKATAWGMSTRAGVTRIVVGFTASPDYAIRPNIQDGKDGMTQYALTVDVAAKKAELQDRKLTRDVKLGLIQAITTTEKRRGITISLLLNAPVTVRQHFIIPPPSKAELAKEKPQPGAAKNAANGQKIWRLVIDVAPTESEQFLAMGVMPSTRPLISSDPDGLESPAPEGNAAPRQPASGKAQAPAKEPALLKALEENSSDASQPPAHNTPPQGAKLTWSERLGLLATAEFWQDAASMQWFANLFTEKSFLNPRNIAANAKEWLLALLDSVQGKSTPSLSPSSLTETQEIVDDPMRLIPIALDPGHGGADPGAVGADNTLEKHVTLQYAQEIKSILEATGKYRVIMTRNDDSFLRLRERVALARADNAILMVSLHADSWSNPDVYGAALYTLSDSATDSEAAKLASKENKSDILAGVNAKSVPAEALSSLVDLAQRDANRHSVALARYILAEMKGQIRLARRPYRAAGFAVLTAPDMPSVLIELGYLSNPTERSRINNPSLKRQLSAAIARGIDNYVTQNHLTAASVK
ncbi:MAG: N-acetylmuramoyl-L-alanine amidase [Candidatus Symbiobacter sp.]|nr:N-acetylmuramoyl-L-alanine amidase [Candidatus Symbiobacter sp.]